MSAQNKPCKVTCTLVLSYIMTLSAQEKGKGRALPSDSVEYSKSPVLSFASSGSSSSQYSSSSSESESDSSDSSEEDEDEDEISQEYLDSLIEKARRSIAAKAAQNTAADKGDALEDDIIELGDPESELKYIFLPLPLLPSSHVIKGASLR
jgi:hypothetical protein